MLKMVCVNSDFDRFISHKLSKFINDTKYKNIIVIMTEPFPLTQELFKRLKYSINIKFYRK